MRQQQTQQQTNAQHAAAIHKPLHDDGALLVIQLHIGGADFLLRDNQLIFQLLILRSQAINGAVAVGTLFCISEVR